MGIDAERLIYRLMFLIDSFKKFNAPVKNLDSEGLPRSTAPGNSPDLIINYDNFDLIIETTTLLGKNQKRQKINLFLDIYLITFKRQTRVHTVFYCTFY